MRIEDKEPLELKKVHPVVVSVTPTPTRDDYLKAATEHCDIADAHARWGRVILEMSREADRYLYRNWKPKKIESVNRHRERLGLPALPLDYTEGEY